MKKAFSLLVAALFTLGAFAQDNKTDLPKGQIEGTLYTNWHYDFTKTATQKTAFDITRVYLGYKYQFSETISGKVLFEVQRNINEAALDAAKSKITLTNKSGAFIAQIKNAYLEWKNIAPKTTLELGAIATRTFKVEEGFWGYRYIYKALADQNGLNSSADIGANAIIEPIKDLKLNVFALNGEGYKLPQDANGRNKYGASIEMSLIKNLTVSAYYDQMSVYDSTVNQSTLTGFIGYKMENIFRVGTSYNTQTNVKGDKSKNLSGISVFGAVSPYKKIEIFGRYDQVSSKNNYNVAVGTFGLGDGNTIIGGIQYSPVKGVKVSANYQGFNPSTANAKAVTTKANLAFLNFEFKF